MSSEWAQLLIDIHASGFNLVRSAKHGDLFRDSFGSTLQVPHTPSSNRRSLENTRADLNRAIRARAAQQEAAITPQQQTEGPEYRVCKRCQRTLALDHFRKSHLPNAVDGARLWTCNDCMGKVAGQRTTLVVLDDGHEIPVANEHLAELAIPTPQEEPPVTPKTFVSPDFDYTKTKKAAPKQKAANGVPTPEEMATRLLIRKHRGEYDELLEQMMAALGFDE